MENSSNVEKNESLEGWTKNEKFILLQALKEYSSYDIAKIKFVLTTKTEDEIIKALKYYRKKAQLPATKQKKSKRIKCSPVMPLANWAKFLVDFYGFDDLQTDTATALRIIAEFEDRPPAACTEKIDFKNIYYMLADALEGKTIPYDKLSMAMFDKCKFETALTSKAFIRSTAFKEILKSINLLERNVNEFAKPTTDFELANLRHLTIQNNYNPLKIPEKYLQSLSHVS